MLLAANGVTYSLNCSTSAAPPTSATITDSAAESAIASAKGNVKAEVTSSSSEPKSNPFLAGPEEMEKPGEACGPQNDDFASFISEIESFSSAASSAPKKVRTLPAFLFPNATGDVVISSETNSVVPSSGPVKIKFGTSTEECERLTSRIFNNAYEIFNLPADADDEHIKKAFRKISLLIHPDKCKHPKAAQAFHIIKKALEDIQKPETKERYKLVIGEAKKRVIKRIVKENREREKNSEPPLPTDDDSIADAVTTMCDKLLQEWHENAEYAEKCRKANEEWERKAEEQLQEEAKQEEERKRKWAQTMDTRVGDWRDFREGVETKKTKTGNFVPVAHQREKRRQKDKSVPHKPMGIDEDYKLNWR